MRAEPLTPAGKKALSPLGGPLKNSYTQNREVKTESIYSQLKNNRSSFLDNRASFLGYRPSKKDLLNKPSREEKRLTSAILRKTPTSRRSKTPASRCKSDSEAYSYSQDYNTGTLPRDDDIDHLEDLRLSLLSWTTTTHESFVGSASMPRETRASPMKYLHRSISDISIKKNRREDSRTPEKRPEVGKTNSVTHSGRSSQFEDVEGTDDEVARIMVCISITVVLRRYSLCAEQKGALLLQRSEQAKQQSYLCREGVFSSAVFSSASHVCHAQLLFAAHEAERCISICFCNVDWKVRVFGFYLYTWGVHLFFNTWIWSNCLYLIVFK